MRLMSDDTYEFIKAEIVDLFVRYDIHCKPINGSELATKMGITLIPYSSLTSEQRAACRKVSSEGFYCEPGDGRECIYYDDSRPYDIINMTILHEIGHAVLGHSDATSPDVAEAEARFFAKYAIAPPPLVHQIQPHSPADICKAFLISPSAAQYAYEYYHKWLECGSDDYTTYELTLLNQFDDAV